MGEIRCPHCETEVDEHEANRCLDAWVGRNVFGRAIVGVDFLGRDEYAYLVEGEGIETLPHYSTSIAAAWEVVGRAEIITVCRAWDTDGNQKGWTAFADDPSTSNAETAPLAICRAALKAVEGREFKEQMDKECGYA